MTGLQITVLLGAAVLVAAVAAPKLRIAPPLLLLVLGLALGFVPQLRDDRASPRDGAAAAHAC